VPVRVEADANGRPVRLVVQDRAPLYVSALTTTRTPLWVYPLLPLGLAVDAVSNPVLLLFAPAVIVVGD
jgi:hypothetical protein